MVHEDIVNCEGCGAEITHIVCGDVTEDEDYRLCDSCIAEATEHFDSGEEDHTTACLMRESMES